MPAGSRGRGFPKEERILDRRDFLRAQGRGKKVTTAHLIGVTVPSRAKRRRVGLTVSSKVGNAVERNQVKRWLREIYRHEKERLPEEIDLVIIAKAGAPRAGYWRLHQEFLEIARRLSSPAPEKRER
jgi:ribonuclease P protein component